MAARCCVGQSRLSACKPAQPKLPFDADSGRGKTPTLPSPATTVRIVAVARVVVRIRLIIVRVVGRIVVMMPVFASHDRRADETQGHAGQNGSTVSPNPNGACL